MSPTQLSRIVLQTTSGMTKTLRRLEAAALVERIPDPDDRRGRLVRLTTAGSHLIEDCTRQMFDRWNHRMQPYSRTEQAELASTLWSFVTLAEESFIGPPALAPAYPGDKQASAPAPPPA
jgi:DNA-binding MarR family transcriptional regulator